MKSFRYLIAIALLLIVATGCEDKEDFNSKLPVNKELAFSSHADIYNISLEQCTNWEVKSYPAWATPMQEFGTGDTKISVFVEDNFTEEERKGVMVVVTDKNEITYSLTQRSTLTEDDNATVVSDNILNLTYGVGFGINVFGNPPAGDKYDFAGAIVNPALLTKMLAEVGEADAFCAEDHYFSHTESLSGTSTTSLSTQLSVNAGIEAEISGFSGSLSGKFTNNESTNTNTAYAMREIKHIVGSRYLRPGVLRYLSAANKTSVFAAGFNELVEVIKEDPNEKDAIHDLLESYGTHLIVHGILGGELELAMEMTSTETISEMDINAALNVSSEVVKGDASFTMTDDEKKLMKNTKISLRTYGGSNVYTLKPGTTFEEAMQEALNAEKLNSWVKSIKDKSSLALIDVQLYPIYDLMPDATTRAAVREYMINEYQERKTKKKPLLFAVNGFGDNGVVIGEAYIPELDIKLECYSEKIPEISSEEPVIMIYSGTKSEMNYNTGFFIGSETMKPGKLRKNREGIYSFEPFEELREGQITELYVNATGDITIAAKPGVAYSEVQFTGSTKKDFPFPTYGNLLPGFNGDIVSYNYNDGISSIINNPNCWYWRYGKVDTGHTIAASTCIADNADFRYLMQRGLLRSEIIVKTSGRKIFIISSKFLNNELSDISYYDSCVYPDSPEGTLVRQVPDETAYILVTLNSFDPDWGVWEEYDFIEEPNLKLNYNYDNTPRWRN